MEKSNVTSLVLKDKKDKEKASSKSSSAHFRIGDVKYSHPYSTDDYIRSVPEPSA